MTFLTALYVRGRKPWTQVIIAVRRSRWLLFALAMILFGFETLLISLDNAKLTYGEMTTADWAHTNYWLKSAECARQTGAWLVTCDESGNLRPVSEEAIGDDPGHALLLGLWATWTDEKLGLLDVALVNLSLNGLGFVILAAFLFSLRAYPCALLFLYLGPVVYLRWTGVSPHWGLLGVASVAAILPMSILGREYRYLPDRKGLLFLGLGMVGLALATLVREAIALMAITMTLAVIGGLVLRRRAMAVPTRGLVLLGLAVALSYWAPYSIYALRDWLFDLEPSQLVQRHGFSDILYMGLGWGPNPFNISYDDYVALSHAREVDPDVVHCSPEYFQIMWRLYWDKVLSHPTDVAYIYLMKAWAILSDPVLEPGLPVGLLVFLSALFLAVARQFGLWRRLNFRQGELLLGSSLAFMAIFLAQAVLASPDRGYAMPMGAAILTVSSLAVGLLLRLGAVALRRRISLRRHSHPLST